MKIPPYQIDSYIKTIASNKEIYGALIYGPESGLTTIRAKVIGESIVPNLSDSFLVNNLSDKQIDEDNALLFDEFVSIPMLGDRKLIFVRDAKDKICDALKAIFEDKNPSSNNFILITAGELDSNSKLRKFAEANQHIACLACYEDDNNTIAQIIRQKLKEYNLNVENGVVELITDKFGKNRLIVLNEIEKLATYMGEDKNLTVEITETIISDISDSSITEFTNHLLSRDPKQTALSLQKLYNDKIYPISIIRAISAYFIRFYIVKNNLEKGGNLESEVKSQRLFFKQEPIFKRQVSEWPISAINEILAKLQELESKCKTPNATPELMLANFCNLLCVKYRRFK